MKKMNTKGFSLVELIIVIAIMAILAAALAPQLIKYLEESRAAKTIGKSLDAKVEITVSDKEKYALLSSFGDELETVFIVSGVTVNEGEDEIKVSPADGCKCVRCWKFSENGKDTEGGFLCVRCSDILGV